MENMKNIEFQTQVWKEGNMYISYATQLDVASCGKTIEEARKNIKEAVELFIETAEETGKLSQILEEAGYIEKEEEKWEAPELLIFEKMHLSLK